MPLDASQSRVISIVLRVPQLILSFVALGIVTYHVTETVLTEVWVCGKSEVISFITITSTYITPTFLLMVCALHRESFEGMRKSFFELVYNIFACILQGCAALSILIYAGKLSSALDQKKFFVVGGVLGLINAALCGASIFIALLARRATA